MQTVAADGKERVMLCLPLDYLNGWLFKIDARRYKGERQALIIRYQKECYRVLAEHFLTPKTAVARIEAPRLTSIEQVVTTAAEAEAAKIRQELAIVARRNGITDEGEFASLCRGVTLADPETRAISLESQGRGEPLHPATFKRVLDRFMEKMEG